MSNKQSSVEWLIRQLPQIYQEGLGDIWDEAIFMHKTEILKAHVHGRNVERGILDGIYTSEQYYNETYGGGNK
jgi:hypothetical protein